MSQFAFENLDVYKRALAFSKKILTLTKEIKNQYSWCDQLNRAATSITLNLAEGSGRWHSKDRKNFFIIARGNKAGRQQGRELLGGGEGLQSYETHEECHETACNPQQKY